MAEQKHVTVAENGHYCQQSDTGRNRTKNEIHMEIQKLTQTRQKLDRVQAARDKPNRTKIDPSQKHRE